MGIVFWGVLGFTAWMLAGACVMSSMEGQDDLHKWADREPFPGLTLMLWPLWVWAHLRNRK